VERMVQADERSRLGQSITLNHGAYPSDARIPRSRDPAPRRDSGLWIDRDDFARQLNHPFHTSRGSIGKVLPGREIKLAEGGEILVRGSGVASGYWNGRELQPVARTEDEGWYRTGDLGALDEQGNLFFKGRKKEVIVTPAGMNIYPEDLEAALRGQNEVRDCAVVGLERGGNAEPCAVLILRDREMGGASVEEIVRRANETLAEYQRMRVWFVWPDDDFPRSSTQETAAECDSRCGRSGIGGACDGSGCGCSFDASAGRIC